MKHDIIWKYARLSLFIQIIRVLRRTVILFVIIFSNKKKYIYIHILLSYKISWLLTDKGNFSEIFIKSHVDRLPIKQFPSTNRLEEDRANKFLSRGSEKKFLESIESRWKHVPLRDRKPPRRTRRDHLEATHVQCRETRRRCRRWMESKADSARRNHGLISEKRWTHERVDKSREIPHRNARTRVISEPVYPTMLNWIDIQCFCRADKLDRLITNYSTPIRAL